MLYHQITRKLLLLLLFISSLHSIIKHKYPTKVLFLFLIIFIDMNTFINTTSIEMKIIITNKIIL